MTIILQKNIDQIKHYLKNLDNKFKAARDNLARDEMETERWKDALYHQALDSLENPEIPIGIKGTIKIAP